MNSYQSGPMDADQMIALLAEKTAAGTKFAPTQQFYMRCPTGWTGEAHRGWDNEAVRQHDADMARKYHTPLADVTYNVGRFQDSGSAVMKLPEAVKQHNGESIRIPRNDRPGQFLC